MNFYRYYWQINIKILCDTTFELSQIALLMRQRMKSPSRFQLSVFIFSVHDQLCWFAFFMCSLWLFSSYILYSLFRLNVGRWAEASFSLLVFCFISLKAVIGLYISSFIICSEFFRCWLSEMTARSFEKFTVDEKLEWMSLLFICFFWKEVLFIITLAFPLPEYNAVLN